MVETKVDEPTQIQDGEATVVPPRLEVAEDRRGAGEDFAALADEITVRGLDFFYGKEQALFGNTIEFKKNRVTAVIGPSGCGKSTHLRALNRIFNLYRDQRASGEIMFDGANILSKETDLLELRRRIGMIFQKPSPFPMSVFDNVAYGLRQHYRLSRSELSMRVEARAQALGDLGRGQAQAATSRATRSPAASSSASASRAPSPPSRTCC